MFKSYIKSAWRNLWKNRAYSFLNIFGLALGITCAGLIFLWGESELTFDHFNSKKNELYQLKVNAPFNESVFTMESTPRPLAAAIKADIPGIANTARYSDGDQKLLFSFDNTSVYATGRYTDASLFSMFTFTFLQGNASNPFPQLYSLVITKHTAKKFFGTEENAIGRTIRIDNKQNYVITGVVEDMPENSSLQFEWLAPYDITMENRSENIDEWDSYGPFTYVELDKNADFAAVNNQLRHYIKQKAPAEKSEVFLFPMEKWRLYDAFANGKPTGGGRIAQVRMLSMIAWIILLIACINFMNLATAQSEKRAKEVGVRKVLGSGKKRLLAQFIGEAFMMAAIAAIFSVLFMYISLPAFNTIMQKNLVLNILNPNHLIFLITVTGICGLLAGSYPSIYLSSFDPLAVLKGAKIKTHGAALVRKGLVVTQFAISIIFTISTIVVYAQIQHVKNRPLGFNKSNLIEINPQHNVSAIFPIIKQDFLHTGLIENAALAGHVTLYGGDTDDRFRWANKPEDQKIPVAQRHVSPEFISTSGMKILEGRDFGGNTLAERANVIINKSMADLIGEGSVVGKIIQSPRGNPDGIFTDMTVIGVVSNFVYGNIYGQADPMILFCKEPEFQSFIYARIKNGANIGQAVSTIETVMKKNNPNYPLDIRFVDDQFDQLFKNEALTGQVSTVFAVLAILISCLGLFGLSAYIAERKTKEIGIRKVLGASITGIVSLLSIGFLKLVGIACLIAFPCAGWIMHNWLQSYSYRIHIGWWMFLVAGIVAFLIAMITISFQSMKAAMADPAKSLRNE
ncbi:ABC transporter permease [Olivibacter sp. 47]|uniref:ABC transporter permease n=1 Tax=Olivibacter sp. 47 TaxID=3056486 RepID=UPI0025A409D0|nr:ABC transporter permease [Olivibacter sp. 47]MDM8176912.1 ABC transporter permease [Olivibacter sp. 47]